MNSVSLGLREQAFIGGLWVGADSGATFAVNNPATGAVLGHVPDMGASRNAPGDRSPAARALPSWRDRAAKERAHIMRRWFELIMADQERLARIITAEMGKPLAEARGEIAYAAQLHRVVRRGGPAHLWRRDTGLGSDRRLLVVQTGDRRHRGDHAVEFPLRHVRAQGRRGARRRLHDGGEACRADALLGAGAGRTCRARRRARRRDQCGDGEGPGARRARVHAKSRSCAS